jgi:peptide/nickel transport system substrate-binding protein
VEAGRRFDPGAAGRLLDESGWTLAADGIRAKGDWRLAFECVIQDDTIHHAVARGVRDHLRAVGVSLDLRPVRTFQKFYEACRGGPASFVNKWLWQDPVDASIGFTATWGSPSPNWQHASVPSLDKAYRDWLRAQTPQEHQSAASRIQMIVADELPYIPLLVPHDAWVIHNRISGLDPAPAILYPFYHTTTVEA